jgi:glycosyltransferase involved in cell wall biosynthesis
MGWLPIGMTGQTKWEWEGMPMYPVVDLRDMGEAVIGRWVKHFQADVVVSVTDHWIWKTDVWKQFKWVPIAFPDHNPMGAKLVSNLQMAHKVVVPTEWGTNALREAGVKQVEYIPLGVDTKVFRPDSASRAEQRMRMIGSARRQGAPYLTEDCIIFGVVARNSTYPFRKCQDLIFDAAAQLLQRGHKDFLIYMHSMMDSTHGGIDLVQMINAYARLYQDERVKYHVLFPPPEQLYLGGDEAGFSDEKMAALYNSMDCLLNPSQWEGFGLTPLEAQACGVPVIVTDAGCQPEIGVAGWKVPVYRRFYANHTDTFIVEPDLNGLVRAMETALRGAGDGKLKEKAVRHARKYDWDDIVNDRWVPFLEGIEAGIGAAKKGLVAVA